MRKRNNENRNMESFISPGVEIKGDIISNGSIRVDGYVEGKLHSKGDLVVGEKGKIKGEVKASNLILAGKIEGDANISERLEIAASGSMLGEVSSKILSIEEGGCLEGTSKMSRQKEKAEPERAGQARKK
ncbi:MAG: polymer-forming cytoskeletal protein [Syntrophomonadaceae bacterium]|nr:polymer-forming cytoskeletal protein [Syntrophomonadaceae bacterium]MDD3888713.1 polymer-forming cytoskeletal protein [Syntrophomonadaceae bacterium]MDD4548493.1 polymer-forming cytoskeletal protein [Syntrophomonadaceae bacterium]